MCTALQRREDAPIEWGDSEDKPQVWNAKFSHLTLDAEK